MNPYKVWDNLEEQIYKKIKQINQYTQDEIQDLFNEIDLSDTRPLNKNKKEKLGRYILKCKENGIYSPYILYMCNKILSKTNIYQKDLLEIKLLLIYDNQYKQFDEINQIAFKEVLDDGYTSCMIDINKTKKNHSMDKLLLILLAGLQRWIYL